MTIIDPVFPAAPWWCLPLLTWGAALVAGYLITFFTSDIRWRWFAYYGIPALSLASHLISPAWYFGLVAILIVPSAAWHTYNIRRRV